MNVFNKLTIKYLKQNRTRTLVTILGIVLSAAMICGITTFATSIKDYMLRGAIHNEGLWHGSQFNTDQTSASEVLNNSKVESGTLLQQLGYAELDGSKNELKPYIYVLGADENAQSVLPIHITSGSYPTSATEILLPEHILSGGGMTYKIGDTISLDLGERNVEGIYRYQDTPCYAIQYVEGVDKIIKADETIEVRESRTFKVVGFYERMSSQVEPYSAPGYTALTLMDSEVGSQCKYSVLFAMKNPSDVYLFMDGLDSFGVVNSEVLTYLGVSRNNTFLTVLYALAAIIIALVMFISVALIYNAFAISVSERTKQFGLLSSIGATKKQLRKMVFFEAFAVSAVGVPLGIISGISVIGVALALLGDKFGALGYSVDMKLSVSIASIVIAAVVSFITVMISAWIPSKRAIKISAIEAIRQTTDIKTNDKPVRTSKLTYLLFGLPGVLANSYYKRNRKKYRTTIISLFTSIVLFVSVSSFGNYLMATVEGGFGTSKCDLGFVTEIPYGSMFTADEILALTSDDKGVEQGVYAQEYYFIAETDKSLVTEESLLHLMHLSDNTVEVSGNVYFVNDSEFRRLLSEYGLNETEYFDPSNPLAIAVEGNALIVDQNTGKYIKVDLLNSDRGEFTGVKRKYIEGYRLHNQKTIDGKEYYIYKSEDGIKPDIELTAEEADVQFTIRTGKTINESPFYIENNSNNIKVIYPISMKEYVVTVPMVNFTSDLYNFYYTSSDHKVGQKSLTSTLSENGIEVELPPDENLDMITNYAVKEDTNRNVNSIMQVFSYGLIVMISLVSAANVFNTVSTNVNLRRREFAMLKTVGMTQNGFNKMMNYECLLYGSRALLLGLPVSVGITYLIYRVTTSGFAMDFHLPWSAMAIATFSVFLVVFSTMMYSMSKIKKDNPIDALKNENL